MPEQRLMLRAGYPGRGRRLENGGSCPPGQASAELWHILTGKEPPNEGVLLATNMLVARGDNPEILAACARKSAGVLIANYPLTEYSHHSDVMAAVDAGPSALYLLDVWHIDLSSRGQGRTKDYASARRLVGPMREPLVAVALVVRPLNRLILPK